ncbi:MULTISPECIES: hypothetical protein [unclassified Mycobacterium]|uniref:hypothetical protein n=1 Tax=unclassified Mycobacterium TaxID=2642494 RepID=UPI0029C82AE0|nr:MULTISPECIES: hypothetical protein [unclassified Mycobacterium]
MAEGRGPENFFLALGIFADSIAVLGFARVPIDNYPLRFGVVLVLGVVAIAFSLVNIIKFVSRVFSSSLVNDGPDLLRLLTSLVVFIVGIILLVILPRVPHNEKPAGQSVIPVMIAAITTPNQCSVRTGQGVGVGCLT